MFTETELIDAMRHSAGRAEELEPFAAPSAGRRGGRRWSRFALPAAAAASVLALATGAVLLSNGHDAPAADAAASATRSTHPSSTHPSSQTPATDGHVAADIEGVLDPVQIQRSVSANWMLGGNGDAATGSSQVEHPLPGGMKFMTLDVVGPHAGLDPDRIPRDHPVQIAGTSGYYSKFKLFPLDGNHGRFSDKYLAHWTIAFRTPDGDWAFAHIEKAVTDSGSDDVSVADPGAIVAAYDKLGVAFEPGRSRVPLRTGYLPGGMELVNASFGTGFSEPGFVDAYFAHGKKTIDIQLAPRGSQSVVGGYQCANPAHVCGDAHAIIGGYKVDVLGTGYDHAKVRKVLRTLHVAKNPKNRSAYWTLAQAFG